MKDLFELLNDFIEANPILVIAFSIMLAVFLTYIEIKRNYRKRIN